MPDRTLHAYPIIACLTNNSMPYYMQHTYPKVASLNTENIANHA